MARGSRGERGKIVTRPSDEAVLRCNHSNLSGTSLGVKPGVVGIACVLTGAAIDSAFRCWIAASTAVVTSGVTSLPPSSASGAGAVATPSDLKASGNQVWWKCVCCLPTTPALTGVPSGGAIASPAWRRSCSIDIVRPAAAACSSRMLACCARACKHKQSLRDVPGLWWGLRVYARGAPPA